MRVKDENKRKDIIKHTLDIVYEKGIAGVKMASLARKVGLSPATLYIYFKNKEDLILSIFSELIGEQADLSLGQLNTELPYKLKLKKIWLQWLNFSINNFKEKAFIDQVKQSPYCEEMTVKGDLKLHDIGTLLFQEGKEQGLLKEVDNSILKAIMTAMLNESVVLILNKQMELNEENADTMFSMLWDAIKS
ncbi:TetR family transcriptional regulator [Leptobacterium flavescens]|uniref:TetR family transcriptional regulator n=1 Tax=Leptobacterium flavescens TaxID=472055 RepID=A0A6P0UKP0_9FLAO|nr:TetR/AcrR family transcriptional regulator [Leptobacterium flavescens]NER12458.1 TetR family transcriptional regulator [Leptobacterium flavescens]